MISEDLNNDVKPTLGFQRVIQRAVIHVQSSGKEEANGSNVLVAIFSERESHAVYYLQKQNLSRLDVVEYLSHGNNEKETEDFSYVKDKSDENDKSKNKEFLDIYCTNLNIKAKQLKIDPVIGREKKKLKEQSMYSLEEIKITPFLLENQELVKLPWQRDLH